MISCYIIIYYDFGFIDRILERIDNYIDEIKEFLINKPLEEHKKQLDLIKFKNNSKTITQ